MRLHLDISGQELAEYISVTLQAINNFEKGYREMEVSYFLVLYGSLDELCQIDRDLEEQVAFIIRSKLVSKEHFSSDKYSLSQWFIIRILKSHTYESVYPFLFKESLIK